MDRREPGIAVTVLLPCCTFLRVFDTSPEREVLTLPELTSALRRFDIKAETASKIERDIAKIRAAEGLLAVRTVLDLEPRRPTEQAHPAQLRVAVRFEGVLHDATTEEDAWTVAGPPVAGAIEWLERLSTRYSVLIVSPRNRSPGAVSVMRAWLGRHGLSREVAARLVFPSEYPEAALYVGRSHLRVSGELPSLEQLDLLIKTTPELVS